MLDFAHSARSSGEITAGGSAPPAAWTSRATRVSPVIALGFFAYLVLVGGGWWLMLRLVPPVVEMTVFGHVFGAVPLHDHINGGVLLALLLPSALWIEAALVGWSGSSMRQLLVSLTPSLKTDITCYLLIHTRVFGVAMRVVTLGATLISGVWLRNQLEAVTGFSIAPLPAPLPVQLAFYFFVYTFFEYWMHRLDHSRYMWPLHRFHHAATEFAVITSVRVHPAAFTAVFVVNLPMAIIGAPPEVLVYLHLLTVGVGFLIHSKIDADWGWIGRWVIQSPNNHRMHHKLDMSHPTGHYSRAPIWDRLFGTYYREGSGSIVIGVDTPYSHGFLTPRDMVRDYWDFWAGLLGGLKASRAARVFAPRDPAAPLESPAANAL